MSDEQSSIPGQVWQRWEVYLIVADYFEMLNLELSAQTLNKTEHRQRLQTLIKRSGGSIEWKHMNISAVMELLGLPRITGYAPQWNYQQLLVDGVEDYLLAHGIPNVPIVQNAGFSEKASLIVGAAPIRASALPKTRVNIQRIIRRFDPAERDARNRELGARGEELAYQSEIERLWNCGRSDLAKRVRHVSKEEGDGLGYDIHSFDESGHDRLLEVKTTTGSMLTPFYLTANEHAVSIERAKSYRLLRLYDFAKAPHAFELTPPLEDHVNLLTAVYRANVLDSPQLNT